MKRVSLFLMFFCSLFVMFNLQVNASEIFSSINKLSYDSNGDYPLYKNLKLSNGDYFVVDGYNEHSTEYGYINHLVLKRIGKISWEVEYVRKVSRSESRYAHFEHVDAYVINDSELILINIGGIKKINLIDGSLVKENTELTGFKIIEYNDQYLCVGDSVFYDDDGTDGIFIVDEDLNLVKKYNDENSIVLETLVDDKIYALIEEKVATATYVYSLLTFNSDLEVESDVELVFENFNYLESGYGKSDFIKIGNDFYYVCHLIFKITGDSKIVKLNGEFGGVGNDYNNIEIVDDYIVLTGLNQDDEGKIGSIVEIYDMGFNLIQAIDMNSEFGIDKKTLSDDGMSITKGLTVIDNGFIVTGLLSGNKQFISEYQRKYKIITKTDGNGELISSSDEVFSSERIELTIKANEGYKVDYVKAIDSDGNVVKISDNKFIMPSSDVVVEAVFVKDSILQNILTNPPTGDIIIPVILVIGISVVILVRYRKIFGSG